MKTLTCPECKNDLDLTLHPNMEMGQIVECDSCGITLEITNTDGDQIQADIADEGK